MQTLLERDVLGNLVWLPQDQNSFLFQTPRPQIQRSRSPPSDVTPSASYCASKAFPCSARHSNDSKGETSSGQGTGSRAMLSCESLVDKLRRETIEALDREWELGALPDEELRGAVKGNNELQPTILGELKKLRKLKLKLLLKSQDPSAGISKPKSVKKERRSVWRLSKVEIFTVDQPGITQSRHTPVDMNALDCPATSAQEPPNKPTPERLPGHGHGLCEDWNARLENVSDNSSDTAQGPGHVPLPMYGGAMTLDLESSFKLPFNILSSSPRQPIPEDSKKLYDPSDAVNLWKKSTPHERHTSVCTTVTCDEKCLNGSILDRFDSTTRAAPKSLLPAAACLDGQVERLLSGTSNCRVGLEFSSNRSFEDLERYMNGGKFNIGLELIKTLDHGYCVRSNRTFEPNQIIVEDADQENMRDDQESTTERWNDPMDKSSMGTNLMRLDPQMILDTARSSIVRFIKHSCQPNCIIMKWTVCGKPRMALFAGVGGIITGEELTHDYKSKPQSVKNMEGSAVTALLAAKYSKHTERPSQW